ncbi:MAG: helix-turn-helix domain-containing protein [Alphaproteobacteria bacterium]
MKAGIKSVPDVVIPVGTLLRQQREALGWTLQTVADSLCIKPAYIEAIEAQRINELPGLTYALGFVRGYALLLQLDSEQMMERFKREAYLADRKIAARPNLYLPQPDVHAGDFNLRYLLLGAVFLVSGLLWLWLFSAHHAPAPPADLSVAFPPPDVNVAMREEMMANQHQLMANMAPNNFTPWSNKETISPLPAYETTEETPLNDIDNSDVQGNVLAVKALADSWIQIKNKSGKTIFSRILRADEMYELPQEEGLSLVAGNAGGLVVKIGNMQSSVLGRDGEVIRNVILDEKTLRAKLNFDDQPNN